jgi:hypothetical protein
MGNGLKWPYCHFMPDTAGMTQDQINDLVCEKVLHAAGWGVALALLGLTALAFEIAGICPWALW